MRAMTLRRLVLVVLVALVALATAALALAGGASASRSSGLFGIVMRGPIQPVCRIGVPCDEPASVTLVFSRAGREAARVRSHADGRYRIALPPGTYSVRTTLRSFGRIPQPASVRVPRSRYARVDFSIDTGIR